MALSVGVGVASVVVMLVCVGLLLASWSDQTDGYVVPLRRGRDTVVVTALVGTVTITLMIALIWPDVVTVTVAAAVIVLGLVPIAWRWRRNRGHRDPRAGRSRTKRWMDAGQLIYSVGFYATLALLGGHESAYPMPYLGLSLILCGTGTVAAVVLLTRRERCPVVDGPTATVPGWYTDLCFDGRRFWNGSSWVDAAGRFRKYRLVGVRWLAWVLPLALFGWFAWQAQVPAALAIAGVTCGVLVGGGLVLTLQPLPRSPREDVPPVLPALKPAPAGWYPAPGAADPLGVGQLRWWDGASWTDWTYSADRI